MKKIINKTIALIATVTLSFGALAGCGTYQTEDSASNQQSASSEQTTDAAQSSEGTDTADSADVAVSTDENGDKVINISINLDPTFRFCSMGDGLMATNCLLREGLTRYADGELGEGLAESYEHNDDYTQWTFKLRDSGWSNGDPVTADDWVFAIGAMLDGSAMLSYPDFLFEIKNAKAIFSGEADVSTLGVTAVDDKTLVIDLEYPVTYFPYRVNRVEHFGYNRKFAEEVGIDNIGTDPEYTLCNGPFYVDSWEHDNLIVLKKNPYYWNKDNIKYDQVNVYTIFDDATSVNLFLNGELDIIDFAYQRLSAIENAGFTAQTYNNGRTGYLEYNLSNEYLSNKHVREAISEAIDRDAIVNGVLHVGTVADGLIPIGLSGDETKTFREIVGPNLEHTYNLDHAKELLQEGLDELGLSDPSEISVSLLTNNSDEFVAVAGAVQQLLTDNLGINVEVETTDRGGVNTRKSAFEYDLVFSSWGADWDDATNFLGGYERDKSVNPALYQSDEFNAKYEEAVYNIDTTERIKLLGEAEKILLDDQAITPIYYSGQYYAVSDRVDGILRRGVVPYLDLYYATVK